MASGIIRDEIRKCQDCGKNLRIKTNTNAHILTKDQLLHNQQPISNDMTIPDLLKYPICFDCIDHMIEKTESSIRAYEQICQEYRTGIDNITEEIKYFSCTSIKTLLRCK